MNFNISDIREDCRITITNIFRSLRGRKFVFYDKQLSLHFEYLLQDSMGATALKECSVTEMKELKSDDREAIIDTPSQISAPDFVLFIIYPNSNVIKSVAKITQLYRDSGLRCAFHLYYIPHQTVLCAQILADKGVAANIAVHERSIGPAPVDIDLLSLHLPGAYRQLHVDSDHSSLGVVARALLHLQSIYGVIPNIKAVGGIARDVVQRMMHMRVEVDAVAAGVAGQGSGVHVDDASAGKETIDTLIILDREVDLASLFVTPLTYEGLLDDIMGIENGTVWLDASLLDEENPGLPSPESTGVKRSLRLDQRDVIFGEIRNLYVDRYAAHLKSRLVEHKQIRTNFRENKNQTITDIYNMHKQVPIIQETYKSISLHINLAQLIKRQSEGMEFRDLWQFERGVLEGDTSLDQIEDLICGDVARTELYRILRLLCLMSVTNGGIRAAKLDPVRKLIIQTYGYEHMYTMLNLEKAGLIRRKETVFEGTSVWQAVRKSLALVGDNPTSSSTGGSSSNSAGSGGVEGTMKSITSLYSDPSYVAAGFTPLSVRIVQSLVAKSQRGARTGPPLPSWTITREALRSLMGEVSVVEVTQLKHAADELSSALTRTQMEQVNTLTQPSSASSASAGLFSSLSPAAMLNASLLSSANTASSTAAASGVTPAAAQLQVPTNKPVMLLCILGGVTLLEVAAFRYLSNDPKFPFEIVLTSTCVTNGSKFIRALAHDEV